ncbi:hypothetical protein CSV80_14460 [Sporosarcina sp. P12(2017)]|nr:hypothetical protein CSV81_14325 [Sporosarcina sp. P10]PIC59746.1 hypothetical protein CSV80_14460 [Sporosarcina sp. P12(2017)]
MNEHCARNGPFFGTERNEYMFKRALTYCLIFIVFLTALQWLFRPEIRWVDNSGLTVIAFFVFIFVEWITKTNKKAKS